MRTDHTEPSHGCCSQCCVPDRYSSFPDFALMRRCCAPCFVLLATPLECEEILAAVLCEVCRRESGALRASLIDVSKYGLLELLVQEVRRHQQQQQSKTRSEDNANNVQTSSTPPIVAHAEYASLRTSGCWIQLAFISKCSPAEVVCCGTLVGALLVSTYFLKACGDK